MQLAIRGVVRRGTTVDPITLERIERETEGVAQFAAIDSDFLLLVSPHLSHRELTVYLAVVQWGAGRTVAATPEKIGELAGIETNTRRTTVRILDYLEGLGLVRRVVYSEGATQWLVRRPYPRRSDNWEGWEEAPGVYERAATRAQICALLGKHDAKKNVFAQIFGPLARAVAGSHDPKSELETPSRGSHDPQNTQIADRAIQVSPANPAILHAQIQTSRSPRSRRSSRAAPAPSSKSPSIPPTPAWSDDPYASTPGSVLLGCVLASDARGIWPLELNAPEVWDELEQFALELRAWYAKNSATEYDLTTDAVLAALASLVEQLLTEEIEATREQLIEYCKHGRDLIGKKGVKHPLQVICKGGGAWDRIREWWGPDGIHARRAREAEAVQRRRKRLETEDAARVAAGRALIDAGRMPPSPHTSQDEFDRARRARRRQGAEHRRSAAQ